MEELPMLNTMTAGKNNRNNKKQNNNQKKKSGGEGSCYFNNTPKVTNAFMGGENKKNKKERGGEDGPYEGSTWESHDANGVPYEQIGLREEDGRPFYNLRSYSSAIQEYRDAQSAAPASTSKPTFGQRFSNIFKSKPQVAPLTPVTSKGGKNKTSNNNRNKNMDAYAKEMTQGGNKNNKNNNNKKNEPMMGGTCGTGKPMMGGKNNNKNQKLEVGGNKVYTGPRGGKYIMRNGDKVYLNK
jgi:hypothetical protein